MPYGGTWGWLVVFEDDTYVEGVLTITQAESDPAIFSESGEGAFYLCDESSCPSEATGLTVIGQAPTDAGSTLATAFFVEGLEGPQLLAADADNQLGTEIQGLESFVGGGLWVDESGGQVNVNVGLFRLSEEVASVGAARTQAMRLLKTQRGDVRNLQVLDGLSLRK